MKSLTTLSFFLNQWTSYSYGNITITGLEIDKSNQAAMYNSLVLDNDNYNVVTLHGQLGDEISTSDLKIRALIISHSVMCMSIRADSLTTVACTATAAV
mgnify:CR=1 FL=1